MKYAPGQLVDTIETDKGTIALCIPSVDDAPQFMDLFNKIAKEDYIHSTIEYDVPLAEKQIKKMLSRIRKGLSLNLFGKINGELVLAANCFKRKIKSGKYKDKYEGEVGISIKKEYRHLGLGGKLMDMYIKKAKERGISVIYGRFFHENFGSLVLCKSRKLEIYRIDKNKPPHDKGWKKKYFKWGRPFDRVNARIIIE
jgi:GNAT superfamily N-acetyltransferase